MSYPYSFEYMQKVRKYTDKGNYEFTRWSDENMHSPSLDCYEDVDVTTEKKYKKGE